MPIDRLECRFRGNTPKLGPRGTTAMGRVIIANYKLFVENEISFFFFFIFQNEMHKILVFATKNEKETRM